ncbi:MAG: class I SAM-dependent methyltransferase [Roseicyclus sp.]|nr:class I SAM-dependent methyltransferase [Roseicyclus sp.]
MPSAVTFWDKAAPGYAKSTISDPDAYHATLTRTIHHLSPTDRVLELGCGTASTAMDLAPYVAHITATDISPAMIEIGREKVWSASVRNVTLLTGETGDPVLSDGAPYDVILAMNLLHLLPRQADALAQAHALLKPGGLLISKTACLGEKWYFRPLVGALKLIGKAPPVLHQTLAQTRDAILNAGFEPVEELVQSGIVPRLFLVARRR